MKRFVLIYIIVQCAIASFGQHINTPDNFPDPNFRAFVEEYMGVEPGGEFTAEQAGEKTGRLDCSFRNIKLLDGIQFFTGITELNCSFNNLTSLDVS